MQPIARSKGLRDHAVNRLGVRGVGALWRGIALAAAFAPCIAPSQSIYVDLDIFFGGPTLGNGAPSPQFGAAAGTPGFWNRILATGPGVPTALYDTTGTLTSVTLQASGDIGTARGYNNPTLSGDYRLLMADVADLSPAGVYTFRGLANGTYGVYVYTVNPFPELQPVQISVTGASAPNPQIVSGPIPVNRFELGVTHSRHVAQVSQGTMSISVEALESVAASVNGIQLVLVPEPSGGILLILSFFAIRSLRCRKPTKP